MTTTTEVQQGGELPQDDFKRLAEMHFYQPDAASMDIRLHRFAIALKSYFAQRAASVPAILVVNEEGNELGIEQRTDGKWQFMPTTFDGQRPKFNDAASVPTYDQIAAILDGIDSDECSTKNGWWETHAGADFGAAKLAAIKALFDAAPSAPVALEVPEGWQLVPKEPTTTMMDGAFDNISLSDAHSTYGVTEHVWAFMLAAAPNPPQPGEAT